MSNFAHEIGHSVGAALIQSDRICITLGRGSQFSKWTRGRYTLIFYSTFFLGGSVSNSRERSFTSGEKILVSFCGPLMNALFATIGIMSLQWVAIPFIELFIWYNMWLAAINVIPFKIKNNQSDGYVMLSSFLEYKNNR